MCDGSRLLASALLILSACTNPPGPFGLTAPESDDVADGEDGATAGKDSVTDAVDDTLETVSQSDADASSSEIDTDASTSGTDAEIDVGSGWWGSETGSGKCPNGVINIDFPCAKEKVCSGPTSYATFKTKNCQDLGYAPGCCAGQSCSGNLGETACPAGEICAPTTWGPDACQLPNCVTDSDCSSGSCRKPAGACGQSTVKGTCVMEGACGSPDLSDFNLYCGCDGKTYVGYCSLVKAKTNLDAPGPCCAPGKVKFAKNNPLGFTYWEACSTTDDVPGADSCQKPDANSLCGTNEFSCVAELPGPGTISDAAWNELCKIAGFPNVNRVVGRGGPACKGPPSPPSTCAAGCTDPCGCKSCAGTGLPVCSTITSAILECKDDCISEYDCGPGLACETSGNGAVCGGSCVDLMSAAKAKLPSWQACTEGNFCSTGVLGTCGQTCAIPINLSSATEFAYWQGGLVKHGCKSEGCTCTGTGWNTSCSCVGKTKGMVGCYTGMCSFK